VGTSEEHLYMASFLLARRGWRCLAQWQPPRGRATRLHWRRAARRLSSPRRYEGASASGAALNRIYSPLNNENAQEAQLDASRSLFIWI